MRSGTEWSQFLRVFLPTLTSFTQLHFDIKIFLLQTNFNYAFSILFKPRHKKVAGYYVIPSEILSDCLSVRSSVRQRLIIRVRSITLIPFEIILRNLAQNVKHDQTTCRD